MKINSTVIFPNKSRLFMLGDILPQTLYAEAVALFNSYADQPENWPSPPEFAHQPGRLVYNGSCDLAQQVQALANAEEMQAQLTEVLGFSVNCSGVSLWIDLPGYQIHPHYDSPGFEYSLQIYAPDVNHYFRVIGTCCYTEPTKPMFELAYMPNTGYFMDRTQTILHGLNHHIPEGYTRHSIYLRFNKTQTQ
jgi:hypothetical protein